MEKIFAFGEWKKIFKNFKRRKRNNLSTFWVDRVKIFVGGFRGRLPLNILVLFFLLSMGAFISGAQKYEPPTLMIPRSEKTPVIDGIFSLTEWEDASRITGLLRILDGQLSMQLQPEIYITFDDKNIYFAFVSSFDRPLKREVSGKDENIWEDDSFEIFLDPQKTQSDYYHFVFNANGCYLDAIVKKGTEDKSWDANLIYKTSIIENKWIGEVAIPFSALSPGVLPEDKIWGFNICRNYTNPKEFCSFAYVGRSYHNPGSFGTIIFKKDAPTLKVGYLRNPVFGEFNVNVKIESKIDQQLVYNCIISGEEKTILEEKKLLSIKANKIEDITINKFIGITAQPEFYTTYFSLQDKEGHLIFSQHLRFVSVSSADVSYQPSEKKDFLEVVVDFSKHPLIVDLLGNVTVRMEDKSGENIAEGKSEGISQCQQRFKVGISDVLPGEYHVVTDLYDKQNSLISRIVRKFVKPDEREWSGNQIGIDNSVPPPWVPIQILGKTVICWNREYTLENSPFPVQIRIGKEQILTSPISLKGMLDGKEIAWSRKETGRFIEKRDDLVRFETNNVFSSIVLYGLTTIEFDGMIRVDIRLIPVKETILEQLYLEVPLKKEYTTLRSIPLWHHLTEDWRQSYAGVGYIPDEWKSRFIPYLWLGKESGGICWFAENDKNWHLKEENSAIEIKKSDKTVLLRINIIDSALRIAEPLSLTFGLQATPVKPLPENWLCLRDHRTGLKGKTNYIAPQISQVYKWLGFPEIEEEVEVPWSQVYVGREHIRYAQFVKEAQKIGLKFLTYVTDQVAFSSPVPDKSLPEYVYYKEDWGCSGYKDVLSYASDPVLARASLVSVCPETSWQDFFIYSLKKLVDRYGIDGIFVDHATVVDCKNTLHGHGFVKNGEVKPTYPIFATREMRKRVYKMFKQRNKDSLVIHHIFAVPIIPIASFCDAYWGGEPLWGIVDTDRCEGDYTRAIPLDAFRTEFIGQNFGLIPVIIPELHAERYNTVENTETLVALCLLHGTNIAYGCCQYYKVVDKVWQALDRFGMIGADILPYWNNGDIIQTLSDRCKVSIYKKKDRVLLVIGNLGEEEISDTIKIDIKKLGLTKSNLKAEDILTGEQIPIEKERITLSIKRKNFRLIQIENSEH